jgi:hypothetical protein
MFKGGQNAGPMLTGHCKNLFEFVGCRMVTEEQGRDSKKNNI